ncbi:MAG: hypothetical protein OXE05_05485 [Chloroflexi bacterium]|nr:hypothetical protein [Chloroflexota bacterium]
MEERAQLCGEEIKIAAVRMMAAAQAHQRASVWCFEKPGAKPPSIDAFFFPTVSFELILLSIEQSLRLLLLLHYSIIRDDVNHNPNVLYKAMLRMSGGNEGIRNRITTRMNSLGQSKDIEHISEKDLRVCLNRHDSSYLSVRYFDLSHEGKLRNEFEILPRDVQILHCLALSLIELNMDEMGRRGIPALLSMSRVPECEMTDEERALKDRLTAKPG